MRFRMDVHLVGGRQAKGNRMQRSRPRRSRTKHALQARGVRGSAHLARGQEVRGASNAHAEGVQRVLVVKRVLGLS